MDNKDMIAEILADARGKIQEVTGERHNVTLRVYAYAPDRTTYENKATELIHQILSVLELEPEWLLVHKRSERRPIIRQLLSYIVLQRYPKVKLMHVAKHIGITHHSSVLHGRDVAKDLLEVNDELFLSFYNKVKYLIDEGF